MEHFIEAAIELLFSFVKIKPYKRPSLEFKDRFVVRYNKTKSIIILLLFFLAGVAFLGISFVMDNDAKVFLIIFSVLIFLAFFLSSFLYNIKYYVTTETIHKTVLFVFKKIILWKDIICIRVIEKRLTKAK